MNESDRDYLADMLDYAEYGVGLLGSDDFAAVAADRNKFAALCHFLQIVGEAACQVSMQTRSDLAEVPWPKIIGMRHRLVHGYKTVVVNLVVGTIRDDLPPLIEMLRRALKDNPQ